MEGMRLLESCVQGVSLGSDSDLAQSFGMFANPSVVPADAVLKAAQTEQMGWEWHIDTFVERATGFTNDHIRNLVNHPVVKAYIRSERTGFFGGFHYPELFIVTGLHIAKGAKMEMTSAEGFEGQLDARIQVNPNNLPPAHAGFLAQASRIHRDHASFTSTNDFIFAYQCTKIKYRPRDDRLRQKPFMAGDTLRISKRQRQEGHEGPDGALHPSVRYRRRRCRGRGHPQHPLRNPHLRGALAISCHDLDVV
jgi:hypothetical protein